MGSYKIEIKNSVFKDLSKLSKDINQQILKKIELLSKNPRGQQSIKLKGTEHSYRLRVGKYRIVYQINDLEKIVTVFGVDHRKDIYR